MVMARRDNNIGCLYLGIFYQQVLCRFESAGILSLYKYTWMVLVG